MTFSYLGSGGGIGVERLPMDIEVPGLILGIGWKFSPDYTLLQLQLCVNLFWHLAVPILDVWLFSLSSVQLALSHSDPSFFLYLLPLES